MIHRESGEASASPFSFCFCLTPRETIDFPQSQRIPNRAFASQAISIVTVPFLDRAVYETFRIEGDDLAIKSSIRCQALIFDLAYEFAT